MNPNGINPPRPALPGGRPEAELRRLPPMVVLQKDERVVSIIKRHPVGIIMLYISTAVVIAVAALLALLFAPNITSQYNIDGVTSVSVAFLMAAVLLLVVIIGLATNIYWQNQWIITTDSITQISQRGLFARRVSQLSMDSLEDATVDQLGILAKLFNYGTLCVETAGERSKFKFIYCPNPYSYARQILEIHERFLGEHRNSQNG